MKIYSWNVKDSNNRIDDVFEYIASLDFDVLCLQEVPAWLLRRLEQETDYNIAFGIDVERVLPSGRKNIHLAILTPHDIVAQKAITFPGWHKSLRGRLFVRFMCLFRWSRLGKRGILYADIDMPHPESFCRVFCLHLSNDGPERRKQEFLRAVPYFAKEREARNIVCGDFNIVDSPLFTLFNFAMGASLRESMPWYNERKRMERLFALHDFYNPLFRQPTHTTFPNQFDHILLPKTLTVQSASVCSDSVGSDHYPIYVEVAE